MKVKITFKDFSIAPHEYECEETYSGEKYFVVELSEHKDVTYFNEDIFMIEEDTTPTDTFDWVKYLDTSLGGS